LVWDTIFGEIELTKEESELASTPQINRINKIYQLGLVYLAPAFSSAQHTRYDHSLGVLYLANKAGKHLSLTEEQIQALRLAALLHDIGHGPFSHFSEKIMGWLGKDVKHEEISADIVEKSQDIKEVWNKYNLPDRSLIANIIRKKPSSDPILDKILSHDIDVDRIDYLLRDLRYTGLGYSINHERLLQGFTKTYVHIMSRKEQDIAINEDYVTDANFLLLARVMLRPRVYYEPIHRAAEILIFDCLKQTMSKSGNSAFNSINVDGLKDKLFKMDDGAMISELEKASPENRKLINDIKKGRIWDLPGITLGWRRLSPYLQDEIIEKDTKSAKPLQELINFSKRMSEELSSHLSARLSTKINSDEIFIDIPRLERLEEASMKVLTDKDKVMRLEDFSPLASSLKEAYKELWSLLVFIRTKDGKTIPAEAKNEIEKFFTQI